MRNVGDILVGVISLLIALVFIVGGIRLRLGTPTEPEPGFFPFWGGIILTILAGILLFQGWRGKSSGTKAFGKLWGPLTLIVGMVAYVAILEIAGYVIATTLLSAIVLWVLEARPFWVLSVISLGLGVGSYVIFDVLLGVPLPVGALAKFM